LGLDPGYLAESAKIAELRREAKKAVLMGSGGLKRLILAKSARIAELRREAKKAVLWLKIERPHGLAPWLGPP
jgi:hypothetical protein